MDDEDGVTLDHVEARLRRAGIRDENAIDSIVGLVEEYTENIVDDYMRSIRKSDEEKEGATRSCVCAELTELARLRLSALIFALQSPENVVKPCVRCGRQLSRAEFHRDATKPDGRSGTCKECRKMAQQRRDEAMRDRQRNFTLEPEWFSDLDDAEL